MPGWLNNSLSADSGGAPAVLACRIGMALVLGMLVAGLYRWSRRGESYPATFLATLVLLSTSIAMATQIIGDNVARAFSLVGALSVVRFRTVVKDTQDTAFVILAVVAGMAAGANHVAVAVVGMAVVGVASLILWPPMRRPDGWRRADSTLSLRLSPAKAPEELLEQTLAAMVKRHDVISVAAARQGAALDLTYRVRLRPGCSPTELVTRLTAVEGLDNVELRRDE